MCKPWLVRRTEREILPANCAFDVGNAVGPKHRCQRRFVSFELYQLHHAFFLIAQLSASGVEQKKQSKESDEPATGEEQKRQFTGSPLAPMPHTLITWTGMGGAEHVIITRAPPHVVTHWHSDHSRGHCSILDRDFHFSAHPCIDLHKTRLQDTRRISDQFCLRPYHHHRILRSRGRLPSRARRVSPCPDP